MVLLLSAAGFTRNMLIRLHEKRLSREISVPKRDTARLTHSVGWTAV